MALTFVQLLSRLLAWFDQHYLRLTQLPQASFSLALALDPTRSKSDLVLENALLRQPLLTLRVQRQVKKPCLTRTDRLSLLLLASRLQSWKQALLILKPDTLLRWHRRGFKLFWRFRSRAPLGRPRLSCDLVRLIQQMASENPRWGAERIRGELLELGCPVAKDTIQTYLWRVRRPCAPSQVWNTFLKTHAQDVWACDFLPVIDLFFHPVYIFFIIELGSRRVAHFGVTRHPTNAWVAQQLREATPFASIPRFSIRDNDRKYGRSLHEWRRLHKLKFSAPRIARRGPMPFASAFSAVCDANVSISCRS